MPNPNADPRATKLVDEVRLVKAPNPKSVHLPVQEKIVRRGGRVVRKTILKNSDGEVMTKYTQLFAKDYTGMEPENDDG